MKSFVLTLLAFVAAYAFCSAQMHKQTVHRTFVVENITQVRLQLTGNVEIRETKGSRVLVEITAAAAVPNEAMMNFLVENGRYEVASDVDATAGTLTLTTQKPKNVLMVKGQECKEEISYVVYLPASIKFVNKEVSTSSNSKP